MQMQFQVEIFIETVAPRNNAYEIAIRRTRWFGWLWLRGWFAVKSIAHSFFIPISAFVVMNRILWLANFMIKNWIFIARDAQGTRNRLIIKPEFLDHLELNVNLFFNETELFAVCIVLCHQHLHIKWIRMSETVPQPWQCVWNENRKLNVYLFCVYSVAYFKYPTRNTWFDCFTSDRFYH